MQTDQEVIEVKRGEYYFLENGGEMGELIRSHDWASTPLGPIMNWPQSLRTILDVILHSHVPMLLWWGDEMTQLYNNAFRSNLGEQGKHPRALGQRAEACWPENWSVIKPLIDQVRHGNAMWARDQLIPIFRNGRIEEVFWTFGYSPVRDEKGAITGVLVVCHETTDRVRALEFAQHNEQMIRCVVDLAPVGIWVLNAENLRTEIVNEVFLKIAGKSREEMSAKSVWDLFPHLQEPYAPFLDSMLLTGNAYRGREHKLTIYRNGQTETVYLDFVVEPLADEKSQSNRKILIIINDVTDKILAIQKIEESEQRYKMLIAESTVAIALYAGPEMRIQYVNEIMTKYWGKDMSVIGKTLEEAIPEIRGQRFLAQFQDVYRSGITYVGKEEEAILRIGGELQPFYYNYIFKPLKDVEGKVYGVHHMAMDVTEQVLSRKKLEKNEATLRNIILKAPVAMAILRGPDFVVEIANELMFRLWGKSRDQMIDRPLFEALPEASQQGFEEMLEHVYKTGESLTAEAVPIMLPRAGSVETIFSNFLYEAYREATDEVSGVFVVATDITEQVKARQKVEELVAERTKELAESNKSLRRSNNELAQFAYIASHDLQEPARKITTFTEMLQRNLADPDPRSKLLLEKIEHSSLRMLTLIRDILAYSHLPKEKQQICKIDLNTVLQGILEDFELLIEEKNAIVEVHALPVIEGIPVQISQLFGNLLSNALKFSAKERPPAIRISCSEPDENDIARYAELKPGNSYYRISFTDNGIGFNDRNARQIFDIFQRLHGRAEYEGTGIGLAMCKKIAQNHNGDIVAEAVEGKGATFHVFLPRKQS